MKKPILLAIPLAAGLLLMVPLAPAARHIPDFLRYLEASSHAQLPFWERVVYSFILAS